MPKPEVHCPKVCEYALDVGLPEYAVEAQRAGACHACPRYWGEYIDPPVFKYDREVSLSEIYPFAQPLKCGAKCLAGECGGSPWPGCGGCCRCMGGCVVEYENSMVAPFLWEGTYG